MFNLLRSGRNKTRQIKSRNVSEFKKISGDLFMMCMGILSAGFGLKSFLLPNQFLDGGATGISFWIAELSSIKLYNNK